MNCVLFYIVASFWITTVGSTKPNEEKSQDGDPWELNPFEDEDKNLDDALFAGFQDGITFNLDCVSMGRHDADDSPSDQGSADELEKEHQKHLDQAELEAEYLTSHRPLESAETEKKDSELMSIFNILMRYLNSKSKKWTLEEPKEQGLEDHGKGHMVFVSKSVETLEEQIPRNLIFSVGHMKKTMPTNRLNKTPIVLTALESFIVCRLAFISMAKIITSNTPDDLKLQYLSRWIKLAHEHFVLFLPYVAITAPRCKELLEDSGQIRSEYDTDDYKHLLATCKKMDDKRNDESDLQAYVMLDSEYHEKLIERCIHEKHVFPSILQEKDHHLRRIHKHFEHELDWETFVGAANMIFAHIENELSNKVPNLMDHKTWGCGMSKKEAANAEQELIKLFVNTQKKLNLKTIQAVRAITIAVSKKKSDDHVKKSMINYAQKESKAAHDESQHNEAMKKCMAESEKKLDEDSEIFSKYNKVGIARDLRNFDHKGWMECMSGRIYPKFLTVCKNNPDYCKELLKELREEQNSLDPDSTAAIVVENLQFTVAAALLNHDLISTEDIKKHLMEVSKHEIAEMKENVGPEKKDTSEQVKSETREEPISKREREHDPLGD
ncbi:conserved hypothetical protein [Theileria equi strain WA]|uniref:Signal peptide-containing protein n=1 Tax=Theileria equi strain WA TaxID=1537102 RepID=L1LDB9_THEEQ|nr:conserved hypothetical protein [Theileria equi strain WA]EKX73249.1 conserved hypothetical protein [Theileria equi strain WA]|eukprot:XP_004832701.1 conserved hypothetical protein [Theileria equi strain WA]